MPISKLKISSFRNLTDINISTHPNLNIFYGENGSGKTSLLEALFYLSRGRSFRANHLQHIIQHNALAFHVFVEANAFSQSISMGIQREINGGRKIKLDGQPLQSLSLLTEKLPIQFISTESHRFFHDGSKIRRQFLDWGVFHVEPGFFSLWQDLRQVIKQRNACIKSRGTKTELEAWNHQLIAIAEPLHAFRKHYVSLLAPLFKELLHLLLETELSLDYFPGWEEEKSLLRSLQENYFRELQLGYTCHGPHKADLQISYQNAPAQNFLSQGQQKITAYALHLAQGKLMQKITEKQPMYLIDDMPSELDNQKRKAISDLLVRQNAQVFVTGITPEELDSLFSLQQGFLFQIANGGIL